MFKPTTAVIYKHHITLPHNIYENYVAISTAKKFATTTLLRTSQKFSQVLTMNL